MATGRHAGLVRRERTRRGVVFTDRLPVLDHSDFDLPDLRDVEFGLRGGASALEDDRIGGGAGELPGQFDCTSPFILSMTACSDRWRRG